MTERQKALTPRQQYAIDQTVATMKIEDMEPPKDCIDELRKVALSEKTMEQYFKELDEMYKNE